MMYVPMSPAASFSLLFDRYSDFLLYDGFIQGPCANCASDLGTLNRNNSCCICYACLSLPQYQWISESKLKDHKLDVAEVLSPTAPILVPVHAGVGSKRLFRGGYHYANASYDTKVYRLKEVLEFARYKRRKQIEEALVKKGVSADWAQDEFFDDFIDNKVGRKTAAGLVTEYIKTHELN